ncbi:MAG: type IV toxin-antitoxin system AbiEi family antitoxin domain-containing protein [Actinobacteria bacterium]|nr:type IV toxin-antitoxin system AbiEi family antitoxin domain-containing protein [Actinomycetota bacterium]
MPVSTSLGAVGELAASRHGAVTRRQAAEHGLGRNAIARLIARGVLMEDVPGVLRIRGMPPSWEQSLYVATLEGGDQRLAIAASAARLHGIDGFTDDALRVAGRRGASSASPLVVVTQTIDQYDLTHDVFTIDGIRCTTLARTLCDIARWHPDRYERAVDDFVRRGFNLQWLVHTVDRFPARGPWRRRVADDLERRTIGGRVPDSWFERLVEACVRSPILPPVVRQHEVRREDGSFVARVDLAIPSLKMAIEAHSRRWHTGPRAEAFDQARENQLAEEGWHTTFVGWADAAGSHATVRRTVERIARRRAIDLGIELPAPPNAERPTAGR